MEEYYREYEGFSDASMLEDKCLKHMAIRRYSFRKNT